MKDFQKIDVNVNTSQMEQFLVLSNVINYVQYNRNPVGYYELDIRALEPKSHKRIYEWLEEDDRQIIDLEFGKTLKTFREEYLDVYEGVRLEILYATKFNENSDLGTAYLGRVGMTWSDKIKAEEKILISEQSYTMGKVLDGTEFQILLDTGANKSFMSKTHYLKCKTLHSLPNLASKIQRIQVGNEHCFSVFFIIAIIIDIHDHRFEIFTLDTLGT